MATVEETFNNAVISKGEAIVIAAPPVNPKLAVPMRITFDSLAQSTAIQMIGTVTHPNLFTKSLGFADNEPRSNHCIKAPGTDFYIPPAFEQFIPSIKQIIEDHYSRHSDADGYCVIGVNQSIVSPHPTKTHPFISAHLDVNTFELQATGETPRWHNYVVSNVLMTGFSSYTLTHQELETIKAAPNPVVAQNDILEKHKLPYKTLKPYEIGYFDSTTVHALGNPTEPVLRTFLTLGFVHRDASLNPADFNNPWLDKAISAQERAPEPSTQNKLNR